MYKPIQSLSLVEALKKDTVMVWPGLNILLFSDKLGWVADVGQNQWEEIDFLPAGSPGGANFGWNYREGAHPYAGEPPPGLTLIDPIYEYDHTQGCSVTGGFAYRGQALPEWQGIYFFGDYCSGKVWGLLQQDGHWQTRLLFETPHNISSFGQDDAGEIYLLDHRAGKVLKLARR